MAGSSIQGIAELTKAFKLLDANLQKKVGLKMVAKAGTVVKQQAKINAQSQGLRKTGALIRNIAIKRERQPPKNTIQYNVGVRHGRHLTKKQSKTNRTKRVLYGKKATGIDDPFYWRFLEFGRNIYKGVKNTKKISRRVKDNYATGRVPARPFLSPALGQTESKVLAVMSEVLDKELIKASQK